MENSKIANHIALAARNIYETEDFIPLHAPLFLGNEKKYINECIDSTFVSSVGPFVDKIESISSKFFKENTKTAAVSNGTCALSLCLLALGVERGDEVITQNLTFVATANAITHLGCIPHFLDVENNSLALCPIKLASFFKEKCEIRNDGKLYNKESNRIISACVPMHTFGLASQIEEIVKICRQFNVRVIEDAAESLGTEIGNRQLGTFGDIAALSFNGNKIITSGGGGLVISKNHELIKKVKHLSTTAKVPHPYKYEHDQIGYNYRMPNINAALAVAQFENLELFLKIKRNLHFEYANYFNDDDVKLVTERDGTTSNFWLNTLKIENADIDDILIKLNNDGVMARPVWTPMSELSIFKNCPTQDISNSIELSKKLINIPSGVTEILIKKLN